MFREKENVLHAGPQLQPGKAGPAKLAPKTPMNAGMRAPNTPFPLDRENMETAKKGMTLKKSLFQFNPASFITPVGPRRVPLGGKTTNAKAPASELREKIQLKINSSPVTKSVIRDNEDEIPEIEYMPPHPIDLPDIPDDFIEPDYNLIKNNLFTGAYASYLDGRDENGKTKMERKMEAVIEEQEREMIAEADTPEPAKPKKVLGQKSNNAAPKKAIPGKASITSSRPTSRVGRQTPSISGKPTAGRPASTGPLASGKRSKTPTTSSARNPPSRVGTATSRPTSRVEHTSTSRATSRPTSRVGNTSTSRATSRASVRSNGAGDSSAISRPRSVISSGGRPTGSQATVGNSGKSAPKPASAAGKGEGSAVPKAKGQKPKKTIEEESEEALNRLVFADVAGDESEHEKRDVADIFFEGDDEVFQF